jgi:hypothetical protein
MGWENTAQGDGADDPQGDRPDDPPGDRPDELTTAFAGLTTAAAVAAAQLPAVCLLWWVYATRGDDYGSSYASAFGLLCLFVLAPVILPVLGLLHAALHIAPAHALARLGAARLGSARLGVTRLGVVRLRGPEWAWHLLCAALVAVAWAAVAAVLWDWPFVVTGAVLAGLGVLPVLGLAHIRRRATITGRVWGTWTLWLLSALASVGLFALAFVGALMATVGGLIDEYEPPKLSAAQLAGEWHGDEGAVLRLRPDGRAEATKLPSQPENYDGLSGPAYIRCDGTGSWDLRSEYAQTDTDRDGVLVHLRDDCGDDTYWTVGGTDTDPELFVLFGDPDAGELRILERSS